MVILLRLDPFIELEISSCPGIGTDIQIGGANNMNIKGLGKIDMHK